MNDRRLQNLVRMAAEIEELERSAQIASELRLVPGPVVRAGGRARVVVMRIGAFAAAAACVAMAVYFALPVTSPSKSTGPVVVQPEDGWPVKSSDLHRPRRLVVADEPSRMTPERAREIIRALEEMPSSSETATGVLAIFEDDEGVVRCVKWHEHNFGGRSIDQLAAADLVRATYGPHCSVIGPHRLIAVAVTGPKEKLPDSDERAQALAQCIVGGSPSPLGGCDLEPALFSKPAASGGCVPKDLKVVVATLGMGRS